MRPNFQAIFDSFDAIRSDGLNINEQKDLFAFITQFVTGEGTPTFEERKKMLYNFTSVADFPQLDASALTTYIKTKDSNVGWQLFFNELETTTPNSLQAQVQTIGSSVAFRLTAEGEPIAFTTVSGALQNLVAEKFTCGLAVSDETIRNRDANTLNIGLQMTQAAYAQSMENKHVKVLIKGVGSSLSYTSGTTQVNGDIANTNQAIISIMQACRDKGFGNALYGPFVILHSPAIKDRIQNMINPVSFSNTTRLAFDVVPVASWQYDTLITSSEFGGKNTDILIALPGRYICRIQPAGLLNYSFADYTAMTSKQVFAYYAQAAVLDTAQIVKQALA